MSQQNLVKNNVHQGNCTDINDILPEHENVYEWCEHFTVYNIQNENPYFMDNHETLQEILPCNFSANQPLYMLVVPVNSEECTQII